MSILPTLPAQYKRPVLDPHTATPIPERDLVFAAAYRGAIPVHLLVLTPAEDARAVALCGVSAPTDQRGWTLLPSVRLGRLCPLCVDTLAGLVAIHAEEAPV